MESNNKKKRNKAYAFVQFLANVLSHTIMPVTFHNREQLNMDAPYILIANHHSMLDPLYLSYACRKHEIRWLGKKEIAKMPVISWFAKKMDMIHVDRHNTDMAAMRQCMGAVKGGQVLGIFPEGTRHQPSLMHEVESGTAFIALRAGVPLLPVYTTRKISFFRRAHTYVGQPMDITDLKAQGLNTETVDMLSKRIQETFWAMQEEYKK
ncbi:MAG: 1-acyl-sn-glycerol-3-phosphate acyltransferase [Clostridia bacterium]|nr:1-acyl-sn-glycerol-3-phosphate acyltransferase [Clostridia bacterium]